MRNFIFIFLFFLISTAFADEFTVFEKNGYYGIKDETGNVTVPAVYERLGWSDGTKEVVNGVIGFRQNNLWGLISARNKPLTPQRFYTIAPLATGYIKASIKGKFSNHLFHGVLDSRGRTIISFNYFTIEPTGANWLVSTFDGKSQQFGVVSFANEILIPNQYYFIESVDSFFLGYQRFGKIDLYEYSGDLLELGLDSLSMGDGIVAYRGGYAGYLSDDGSLIHDFEYKSFKRTNEGLTPIAFPEWTVYREGTELMKWKCDSLQVGSTGLLLAYLNGAHHLLLNDSTLLHNHELILKEFGGDYLVVQNSKSRKWSVYNQSGNQIFKNYDSIHSINAFFAAKNEKGWWIVDETGTRRNRLPFQELKAGVGQQLIIKKNDHWGILNVEGEDISIFKYDGISLSNGHYVIDYLNRRGLMDEAGSWVIRPEFHSIQFYGNLVVGKRGKVFTYFYEGKPVLKSTSSPIELTGNLLLVRGEEGYGLLNSFGEYTVYPKYDSIRRVGEYFEVTLGQEVGLISTTGAQIVDPNHGYQHVADFGDGYFVVRKENRWGFVDKEGRLRVSNRYDSARRYQEGLAPINLRNKWGFIDKNETLHVQPYYDDVQFFQNGLAIVKSGDAFGLIDRNGVEVLELDWKSIQRLNTDNYLVQDPDDQFGLVDMDGTFILRPSYDYLEDYGNQVVVSKNKHWGLLDYSGSSIFKINYKKVKVVDDLTMVMD